MKQRMPQPPRDAAAGRCNHNAGIAQIGQVSRCGPHPRSRVMAGTRAGRAGGSTPTPTARRKALGLTQVADAGPGQCSPTDSKPTRGRTRRSRRASRQGDPRPREAGHARESRPEPGSSKGPVAQLWRSAVDEQPRLDYSMGVGLRANLTNNRSTCGARPKVYFCSESTLAGRVPSSLKGLRAMNGKPRGGAP